MRNNKKAPMELYVHIPFCAKKCDYCDFLSGPAGPEQQRAYTEALIAEISAVEEGKGRSVSSVFIGGGTPSLLDESFIGRILDKINEKFHIEKDAEITMEANPGTLQKEEKARVYRCAGINRLSLGLQSALRFVFPVLVPSRPIFQCARRRKAKNRWPK